MKTQFKFLAIFALSLVLFSCGKEDEDISIATGLENAKLSFDSSKPAIEIPEALLQSTDTQAQLAVGYITQANEMPSFISNLELPPDAVKSNTPINGRTIDGGRIAATQNEVLVYNWSNGTTTVAYQISETPEKYIFELFWKFSEDSDFVRVLNAEEFKTKREGFLEWSFGSTDDDFLLRYEWKEDPDGTFRFDLVTPEDTFTINIVSNPDSSGSVKYFLEGSLFYDITWNSDGSGSWKLFSEGTLFQSGDWTV